MTRTLLLLPAAALAPLFLVFGGERPQDPDPGALQELFAQARIQVDLDAGACGIPATVEVTNELLEYLLVMAHGAAHESLLVTDVDPELLNAALLTLGAEQGQNARWVDKDPPPTEEEIRAGASQYDVRVAEGDGFYLYVGWQEGDETYFFRAEDLIRDLDRRRSMRRHRWVYLGSRMVTDRSGQEVFAAAAEGNLINISFFAQGNTLVTAALDECIKQTVWLPNAWNLPARGSEVLFCLARTRLDAPPAGLVLPTVVGDGPIGEEGR